MNSRDISVIITNYKDDQNLECPFEKRFLSNCTMAKVLQEFGLDSALIIKENNERIESNKTLEEVFSQNVNPIEQHLELKLHLISQQNNNGDKVKYKCYQRNEDGSLSIEYLVQFKYQTLHSHLRNEKYSVVHNNKIANRELRFQDLQTEKDHVIELSIIPTQEQEIDDQLEIQVLIFSDQIEKKSSLRRNRNTSNENTSLNSIYEANIISEKLLYFGIEKKSAIIKSLIENLNNVYDILALQSSKGVLDQNKTLRDYFKTESQCKLIALRNNESQGDNQLQQQDNDKRQVNVFYNGKLILREILKKNTRLFQIEKKLRPKIEGDIDFIMPENKVIPFHQELSELPVNANNDINLQVIVRQVEYDRMEAILKQALQQVQEMKKKQKKIEINQEESAYSIILEREQTIDRLQEFIEQYKYKYKENKQDQILMIQTIELVESNQID